MSQEHIVMRSGAEDNKDGGDVGSDGSGRNSGNQRLRTCRVVADYQMSSQDPLTLVAGETFLVSDRSDLWNGNPAWVWIWCTDPRGKSGWTPKGVIDDQAGSTRGIARYTYSAAELTVAAGEPLTVNWLESGWAWCTNQAGKNGWVPLEHIAYEPES